MWTEKQLTADLFELGLREGTAVLAHTSLRAIGEMEGGAETLVRAFRHVLGTSGTLIVPTFNFAAVDPLEWEEPLASQTAQERIRQAIPTFSAGSTPAEVELVGVFPEIVRQQPDAHRSLHPILSFAAIGAHAEFLLEGVPFHYPLGSDSPLARLNQLNGQVLLLGVEQNTNIALHLAEIWAEVPYIHRSVTLKTGEARWTTMQGNPTCRDGFSKIEPLLRQSRLLKQGYVGNAACQWMRLQYLISMAVTMLHGEPSALLCDSPICRRCSAARKMTREQIVESLC